MPVTLETILLGLITEAVAQGVKITIKRLAMGVESHPEYQGARTGKKLEDEITQFNEWVKQANRNLETEWAKLEKTNTSSELEIKNYNDWLRLNKDEEFWEDLNQTYSHRPSRGF